MKWCDKKLILFKSPTEIVSIPKNELKNVLVDTMQKSELFLMNSTFS